MCLVTKIIQRTHAHQKRKKKKKKDLVKLPGSYIQTRRYFCSQNMLLKMVRLSSYKILVSDSDN